LHKAAASGRIALAAPVSVATVVRKVLDALAKVYRDKAIQFALQVDHTVVFYGEEGDLLEILGNLADNACKWCRQQVAISAYLSGQAAQTELVLAVEEALVQSDLSLTH
jgi:two-component system sensor histidine kinase PhoQ